MSTRSSVHWLAALRTWGLAISIVAASAPTSAQITVSRSVIEFTPESRIQDIELVNTGAKRLYLDASVAEILDPGGLAPERVQLADPRTAAVIVTPRQLLVSPGERKRLRIILRDGQLSKERVFRLAIKPYLGKLAIDDKASSERESGIQVLVAYDLLLLARPLPLRPDLKVTRSDSAIEFRNEGNTNILLSKITQCAPDGSECEELEPNRLYVGDKLTLALPKRGGAAEYPVEVQRSVGLENSREIY